MQKIIELYFVWILLLFTGVALCFPNIFINFKPFIPLGLGAIMFGIGMNTPISSFRRVLTRPINIIRLIFLRFMMMPFWALVIAYGLHLNQGETIGLLVLGASPGGTAANVMAYLSKSNVALAVLLTLGSTLLAPIATPGLIYLLLHKTITVHFWPMMHHISAIVLLPVLGGLFINYLKIPGIEKIKRYSPAFSIFLVAFLIATLFALNQQIVLSFPWIILVAVILLNLVGYFTGGVITYLTKYDKESILAAIFDYGMFDAVVAIVICTTFFSKEAAIPAILISIIQNLTAPIIVRYQKRNLDVQLAG